MNGLVGTVHHVSFRVVDLEEALAFYVGVLGCEQLFRPDNLSTPGAWLKAGRTEVHLIEAPTAAEVGFAPTTLTSHANHVAFHVEDMDAAVEYLESLGHPVRLGKNVRQAFVQDPSGNVIELTPAGSHN